MKEKVERQYRRLNPKGSDLLEIAYDLRDHFGLYSSYHGGFKKFDGYWEDMDITIQYSASGDNLEVFVSPKFNPPTDSNIVTVRFTSPKKFSAGIRGGDSLGSHSYNSPSKFGSKIKKFVKDLKESTVNEKATKLSKKQLRSIIREEIVFFQDVQLRSK